MLGGSLDLKVEQLYEILPLIRFLPNPPKEELQKAFSDSISTIWMVMTGIAGLGLLSSFLMKDIPLQNVRDDKWTDGNFEGKQESETSTRSRSSSTDLKEEKPAEIPMLTEA